MPLVGLSVLVPRRFTTKPKKAARKGETVIDRTLNKTERKALHPWSLKKMSGYKQQACAFEEETADDTTVDDNDDFVRRFHVTVVLAESPDQRQQGQQLHHFLQEGKLRATKQAERKHVQFHKYDHVMYPGGDNEYVYSLYDREVEEETRRYLGGEFGGVVGELSNFLNYFKRGIHDSTGMETNDDEGCESVISDSGSESITSDSDSLSLSSVG